MSNVTISSLRRIYVVSLNKIHIKTHSSEHFLNLLDIKLLTSSTYYQILCLFILHFSHTLKDKSTMKIDFKLSLTFIICWIFSIIPEGKSVKDVFLAMVSIFDKHYNFVTSFKNLFCFLFHHNRSGLTMLSRRKNVGHFWLLC